MILEGWLNKDVGRGNFVRCAVLIASVPSPLSTLVKVLPVQLSAHPPTTTLLVLFFWRSLPRRYLRLTAAGTLEWSKTNSYSARRYSLGLGEDAVGVSSTLSVVRGVHAFWVSLGPVALDEDLEDEGDDGSSPSSSLALGSADPAEAGRWLVAVQGAVQGALAARWAAALARATPAAREGGGGSSGTGERSLEWCGALPERDWDAEWRGCGEVLAGLEAAAAADETEAATATAALGVCGRPWPPPRLFHCPMWCSLVAISPCAPPPQPPSPI